MRPKRSKINMTNTSADDTKSKQTKSRRLIKGNKEIQSKRKSRNHRTDKGTAKRESVKKASKPSVHKSQTDIVNETTVEEQIVCNESPENKKNGNHIGSNEFEKEKPQLHCSVCNRVFKTQAGLRKHENTCTRNNTNHSAKDRPFSVTQTNNYNNLISNKLENNLATDHGSSLLPEKAPSVETEVILNKETKIPAISEHGSTADYDPYALSCQSDHSEVVDDIEIKDENGQRSKPRCPMCNKVFNTYLGVRRHESNCGKKKSNERSSSVERKPKVDIDPLSESSNNCPSTLSENGDDVLSGQNKCHCCGEDLETAHTIGDFECKECTKLFRLKSSLERHIRVIHNGESHICPQCGAKCPDKGTLARHMYTHTGLKPYSCSVCKQEFSRKYHLVRHNMQTGCDGREKPVFPCQVCGREFNRKDNLREHLRAHAGQTKRKKKFTCDCCGVEYEAVRLLKLHKKTHAAEKLYTCDFCPKQFNASGALKKHRRTHTGERPYECGTCHRRFAAKETLNRHVRIHTGLKPYCCQYCGKGFIQSSQLKSHLYYHTGQTALQAAEAFVCDLCGRKFNRKARLNEHVKFIHLGAKPFECDQCSKTFIRKEDLNRHRILHSGVKAYQCPICSKAFAMKSTLKVHLLTHTKEPPRSCDACGRAFIRQDCLLRHMRNRHREMLEVIKSEAEMKKLQQQLFQVAAEASLVEGMEEREELDENGLVEAVKELLTILVDETTLRGLGWPGGGVEALLEAIIKRCGHEPAPSSTPRHDRLRHNVKLLFTVVVDDSTVKALLNNQTVDEVILHVLRLAKS